MADRHQIEAMVKRKEQEIEELEARINEAKIYLQALQDVLKKFPRDSNNDAQPSSTLRPGSLVAQARDAILREGHPLHIDEILKTSGKELTRQNRIALGGSLSAYVRKGSIFTRTAPNTFGLIEAAKAPPASSEPPADFGVDDAAPNDLDAEIPF